jgi:ribosome-associated translation inhibitor RaiA
MEENAVDLGGNIRLNGFSEVDGGSMIIIKKLVGSFVKKVSDRNDRFQRISVSMKKIHGIEESKKFEISANLVADKHYNAEVTHQNLMFAIDKVLKKIEAEME